jgi:hypothetical protein
MRPVFPAPAAPCERAGHRCGGRHPSRPRRGGGVAARAAIIAPRPWCGSWWDYGRQRERGGGADGADPRPDANSDDRADSEPQRYHRDDQPRDAGEQQKLPRAGQPPQPRPGVAYAFLRGIGIQAHIQLPSARGSCRAGGEPVPNPGSGPGPNCGTFAFTWSWTRWSPPSPGAGCC